MAKYSVNIKKSAAKEIKRLSKDILKRVLSKIELLSENPRPVDCQKLTGEEKYRVRVGDCRILYMIEDRVLVIIIVRVRHRREVYKT